MCKSLPSALWGNGDPGYSSGSQHCEDTTVPDGGESLLWKLQRNPHLPSSPDLSLSSGKRIPVPFQRCIYIGETDRPVRNIVAAGCCADHENGTGREKETQNRERIKQRQKLPVYFPRRTNRCFRGCVSCVWKLPEKRRCRRILYFLIKPWYICVSSNLMIKKKC